MNVADIIAALELPVSARVDQRVPKKVLLENSAPTSADRRRINEGVDELLWIAALKPTNVGALAYRDQVREYLEIAVLRMMLRAGAAEERLAELVHRAVPYPVLLIAQGSAGVTLSVAHLRWSQGESRRTVLDGDVVSVEVGHDGNPAFLHALSLTRLPRVTMRELYEGWVQALYALQAERRTGIFARPTGAEHAAARREALRECCQLEREIAKLESAASSATQIARQVELNVELKRLRTAWSAALAKL